MPSEPCDGIALNCVWRASQHLTSRGRPTKPTDLCVGTSLDGLSPCGLAATQRIGPSYDKWAAAGTKGLPFCDRHAKAILDHALKLLADDPRTERRIQQRLEHKQKPQKQREYIYFAKSGNRIKIGWTIAPQKRLRALETQGGIRFDKVWITEGTRQEEQRLHNKFDHLRILGEWFEATPELIEHAKSTIHPRGLKRYRPAKTPPRPQT